MSTKTLTHSSPLGALEIPGVIAPVPPGQPFDVAADIADSLLEQSDLYALADTQTAPKKGTAR